MNTSTHEMNDSHNVQVKMEALESQVQQLTNVIQNAKEVMNLEETAIFMGISKSTLYKMTSDHVIPFYRPNGKMIFFEKADLLAWIRKNRVSSNSEIDEQAQQMLQNRANK